MCSGARLRKLDNGSPRLFFFQIAQGLPEPCLAYQDTVVVLRAASETNADDASFNAVRELAALQAACAHLEGMRAVKESVRALGPDELATLEAVGAGGTAALDAAVVALLGE